MAAGHNAEDETEEDEEDVRGYEQVRFEGRVPERLGCLKQCCERGVISGARQLRQVLKSDEIIEDIIWFICGEAEEGSAC